MKDKILKLAKRLDKFTVEDIEPILNYEGVKEVLQELVTEGRLDFDGNIYFYNEPIKQSPLPFCFTAGSSWSAGPADRVCRAEDRLKIFRSC